MPHLKSLTKLLQIKDLFKFKRKMLATWMMGSKNFRTLICIKTGQFMKKILARVNIVGGL